MGLFQSVQLPSAQGNLGALTWTGTADPSGTIVKEYRWIQIGKYINFWSKVTATVAGVGNTSLRFPLPAGVPTPSIWSPQEASFRIANGSGSLSGVTGLVTPGAVGVNTVAIYDDGAGGFTIQIAVAAPGTPTLTAWTNVSWLTA